MDSASLQARIQHEVADLRTLYPQIEACRATLDEWKEGDQARYALQLDIRWAQHQTLISGTAKDDVNAALRAARYRLPAASLARAAETRLEEKIK